MTPTKQNNPEGRLFIGSLVKRPIIYHPNISSERDKRKRNRLIKRYKRMGITEFLDHLFREEGSNDRKLYRTLEACMESRTAQYSLQG